MAEDEYAGGGICSRAGSKRGVHSGVQLVGVMPGVAECIMCGENPHPAYNKIRRHCMKEDKR